MSIKFYDSKKQQWEKIATMLANSVRVLDIKGNYSSQSVEGCLDEIAEGLKTKFDDVELLSDGTFNFYSNGQIIKSVGVPTTKNGGINSEVIDEINRRLNDHEARIAWLEENGGGGGGSIDGNTAPTITTTFDQTHFSTEDEIEIPYFVMDSQGGNFIANYSIDGEVTTETVKVGPNSWKVGVLPKGTHTLKLYLKDYALFSNELVFNITVGSLEISSNFREKDYGLNDNITVNYDIETTGTDSIKVERIINGKSTIVNGTAGRNTWTIGQLSKGTYRISLRAFNENSSSNILTYNFTVTDSNSLYVSTSFEDEVWNVENRLIIPYRVSLMGGSKFKAKYTINGIEQPIADAVLGMNFWDLGYLRIGEYDLTIQATNVSGSMESNIINIHLSVQATDFTPVNGVEDYLLCWFDAKGKSNKYSDREEWIDKSGNNVKATLVDVNYSNNGWIDDGLRLNGDAYCEIDLKPFENGVSEYGLTLDVQYEFYNSGDDDARVFSCEQPILPRMGAYIESIDLNLNGSESINKSPNNEENKIRATFVIDPTAQRTYVYVNGVICNTALISTTDTFIHDSKIYLNARRDENGNIVNLSDCIIYNVRVYDKALTPEEVVQNHISDMTIEEQKKAVKRNTFTSLGQIDFDGDFTGMGADDQVPLRVAFSPNDGPGVKFDFPEVLVDWQGNSSLQYAIKNYNIDLIDEEGNSIDVQMKDDWIAHDSYHIKANMVDSSHAFNLGIAKLLPTIYTEPHPGITNNPDKPIKYAVDGFPVTCFHNGEFHGLYTFNLKQHRKVLGMDKKSTTQFMYRAEENSAMGAAAFRDSSDFSIEQEFEERHPKRPAGTGVKHNELRRLINFVKDSSDAVFVRDLPKHFNKNYLLDYYIICYVFGGIDSLGKNMTLASWDATATSGIWYPMFYDMDTFFGFDNKGELVWGPDVRCPEDYNTSGSLLWERLSKLCQSDIRMRYAQLRRGGLNLDNVLNVLRGEIIDPIGEMFYNMDATDKYLSQGAKYLYMAKGNRVQHLERWLKSRFLYTDSMFEFLPEAQNSIIIRNTCAGLWTLRIKTYTPQLIKVEFGGTGVSGVEPYAGTLTKMCNNKEWTEFSYYFDGVYQRDISISGARYIIGLEGVANKETLMLDVSLAEKLIEIDCSGNPNLTSIDLSNCVRLKKLNAHDCPRLGEGGNVPLNVGNCYNLKYLDISNTSVPAINTEKASYLTYVDIRKSKIAALNYSNLQSLKDLKIESCDRLTSVSIDSCQGITELTITKNPALREIRLENCKNLKSLTVDNLSDLRNLTILNCPGLETLIVKRCELLTNLDVSGCTGLIKLEATDSNLKDIQFGTIANLKAINISGSKLISTLDFGECNSTIETLNIKDCFTLKNLLNINILLKNYEHTNLFRGNDFLRRITGTINFGDEITSLREFFANCIDLEEVPNMNFNNVNILSGMFKNCFNLENVPVWDTSNITDMSSMFSGCSRLQEAPAFNTENVTNFDYMFQDCVRLEEAPNYNISRTTSLRGMFRYCTALNNVPEYNTSHIKDFSEMFADCISLQYLPTFDTGQAKTISLFLDGCADLRNIPAFNTENVTNFSRAFSRCEQIFFVPDFNTRLGEDLSYMFSGCTNLSSINEIDLSSAHSIAGLFENCHKLQTVPELRTENVINMSSLFRECWALTEVPTLDTTNAVYIGGMYYNCKQLTSIPTITTTNVVNIAELFFGCSSLEEIPEFITTDETMETPTDKVTDMRGLFDGCKKITRVPDISTKNVQDFSGMFKDCILITEVPELDVTNATLCSEMFYNCKSLVNVPRFITTDETIPFENCSVMYSMFKDCLFEDDPRISTKSGEDISSLFEGCRNLTSVSGIDTSKAMFMSSIFRNCERLLIAPNVDLSCVLEEAASVFEGCKSITRTPKIKNLGNKLFRLPYLFKNCTNLTEVEVFDLNKVSNISEMFRGCESLTEVPIFNTSKVTNMSSMFANCISLREISSDLDLSGATNIAGIFNGCNKLTTIPLLNTANVQDMNSMFANCTSLVSIPKIDTSSVVTMSNMFSGCKSLTIVPVLDMTNVTSTSNMFRQCIRLENVPALVTNKVKAMNEMFKECSAIKTIPDTIKTNSANNIYAMFFGCSELTELHEINLSNINDYFSNLHYLLEGCTSLTKVSFRGNRTNLDISNFAELSDLKIYDSLRNVTITVNNNPKMTSESLNALFESLAEVDRGYINISGCDGVYGCDSSIAEDKGWTVIVDYSLPHKLKKYTM